MPTIHELLSRAYTHYANMRQDGGIQLYQNSPVVREVCEKSARETIKQDARDILEALHRDCAPDMAARAQVAYGRHEAIYNAKIELILSRLVPDCSRGSDGMAYARFLGIVATDVGFAVSGLGGSFGAFVEEQQRLYAQNIAGGSYWFAALKAQELAALAVPGAREDLIRSLTDDYAVLMEGTVDPLIRFEAAKRQAEWLKDLGVLGAEEMIERARLAFASARQPV